MKPRHVTVRGRATSKRAGDKVNYSKNLAVTSFLLMSLIAVIAVGVYIHQTIQSETHQLRSEYGNKQREIDRLKTEIDYLKIQTAKLQSAAHINLKIREFKLALRPTEPSQVRYMPVRRSSPYQTESTMTATTRGR